MAIFLVQVQVISLLVKESHKDTYRAAVCEFMQSTLVHSQFQKWLQGWAVCAVYCLDSQFVSDVPKFVAGSLQALSAMVLLELPHLNVLTKVDLLTPDSKVSIFAFSR